MRAAGGGCPVAVERKASDGTRRGEYSPEKRGGETGRETIRRQFSGAAKGGERERERDGRAKAGLGLTL
jgi:hypothetical protein